MNIRPRISRQIKKLKAQGKKPEPLARWSLAFTARTREEAVAHLENWFTSKQWKPADFQKEAWGAYLRGESGVLSVPTGHGKTLAAFGGPLIELMTLGEEVLKQAPIIYIAPLKALARDIQINLEQLMSEMGLPYRIYLRTGDTSAPERRLYEKFPPQIIITTPESLALITTQKESAEILKNVRAVIVDEWHELIANKRGSLLELTLARVKRHAPSLRIWGVSATLGNLKEAAHVLTAHPEPTIVTDPIYKQKLEAATVLSEQIPPTVWFGSMGEKLIEETIAQIKTGGDGQPTESHLIFTNTRRAAEAWFGAVRAAKPEWAQVTALHHGSLSKEERLAVEEGLKAERVKIVIATSSLELGVDFPRIQNIYQLGSVKSLGRALQRAGRGLHQPGLDKSLKIIPVSLFDALEPFAIERAHENGHVESRYPLSAPLDVALQHILNSAFNDGFKPHELLTEIRSAVSFRAFSKEQMEWALEFLSSGGKTLKAYPKYQKLVKIGDRFVFRDARIARDHRLNIGTIVGDLGVNVQFLKGNTIGQISEGFAAKLKKGDVFLFSGRRLEFVHLRDAAVVVKLAQSKTTATTSWSGQSLSISTTLMRYIQDEVEKPSAYFGIEPTPELELREALLQEQDRSSHKPHPGETLIERYSSREGHHLFLYFWAGRGVHEGIGHLLAYRLAKRYPNTISVAANDYGIELLGVEPFPGLQELKSVLLDLNHLEEDCLLSLNFQELVKRQFREIARVSGLIMANSARSERTVRHLQMSAGLLFDVFRNYDPENDLLQQARSEVMQHHLQIDEIRKRFAESQETQWVESVLKRLSPFALTLYLERIKSRVSTETLEHRIARFQKKMFEVSP